MGKQRTSLSFTTSNPRFQPDSGSMPASLAWMRLRSVYAAAANLE
jgi:hypothetical protein